MVDATTSGDDRAAEGLAHLQAAARELIAAARAVLDVAEDLIDDPGASSAITDALGAIVRTAASAGRQVAGVAAAAGGGGGTAESGAAGVERIKVD